MPSTPMHPQPRRHRARSIAASATAALVVGITGAPSAASATSDPVAAVPPGYDLLIDDTSTIGVLTPTSWDDRRVDPIITDGGDVMPIIEASPNRDSYTQSFDTPGFTYVAHPFRADPQTLVDEFGLTSGCAEFTVQPYADAVFSGLVQVGTGCGSGAATWNMVVASPADESFTAIVQVQMASAADEDAFNMVLDTFDQLGEAASDAPADTGPADTMPPAADEPVVYDLLVDETVRIQVEVPAAWADRSLTPEQLPDGREAATIEAGPVLDPRLVNTFIVPNVTLIGLAGVLDPQAFLDAQDPPACSTVEVHPYDDGRFSGLMRIGTQCGVLAEGEQRMVIASSGHDQFTMLVSVQITRPTDREVLDTVLSTFGLYDSAAETAPIPSEAPGSAPAETAPGADAAADASCRSDGFSVSPGVSETNYVGETTLLSMLNGEITVEVPAEWASFSCEPDADGYDVIVASTDLAGFLTPLPDGLTAPGIMVMAITLADGVSTRDAVAELTNAYNEGNCMADDPRPAELDGFDGHMAGMYFCGGTETGRFVDVLIGPDGNGIALVSQDLDPFDSTNPVRVLIRATITRAG